MSDSPQAKGGYARAAVLSREDRRKIASDAAKARWAKEREPKRPKRKAMPLKVKLAAALIALGLDPRRVNFDHDPALGLRPLNKGGTDTVPPQLDPRFIVPRSVESHKVKTHGTHVPLSGDISKIAKAKRLELRRKIEAQGIDPDKIFFRKGFSDYVPGPHQRWPKGRKIPNRSKPK